MVSKTVMAKLQDIYTKANERFNVIRKRKLAIIDKHSKNRDEKKIKEIRKNLKI